MNPEERKMLEEALELAKENNDILIKIDARGRRAAVYGFIKLLIIVAPIVIGYFVLEPYINQASSTYDQAKQVLNSL